MTTLKTFDSFISSLINFMPAETLWSTLLHFTGGVKQLINPTASEEQHKNESVLKSCVAL